MHISSPTIEEEIRQWGSSSKDELLSSLYTSAWNEFTNEVSPDCPKPV